MTFILKTTNTTPRVYGSFINGDEILTFGGTSGTIGYDNTATIVTNTEVKITNSSVYPSRRMGPCKIDAGKVVLGWADSQTNGSIYITKHDGSYVNTVPSPEGTSFGYFGRFSGLAVGEDRIVVGAINTTSSSGGKVFIYDSIGNLQANLAGTGVAGGDQFGYAVAVGCGRIVVGAPNDDDNGTDSGTVHVYDLDGKLIARQVAPSGNAGDLFGKSVAIGENRIVVGATKGESNAYSTNQTTGNAYIFDLDLNLIAKVKPESGQADSGAATDNYANNVAIGCGRVVVAAPNDDDFLGGGSLINQVGSVYIYDLNGNFINKIFASNAGAADLFGCAVDVGHGRIIVGAQSEDTYPNNSGLVYVFDLDGNQIETLSPSDIAAGYQFGVGLSIGANKVVVTSSYGDGGTQGAAYVYDLPETLARVQSPLDLLDY